MNNNFNAASFGKLSGHSIVGADGSLPSWPADVGSFLHAGGLSGVDEYCSRVDDELRESEQRYPMIGLVVLASASALGMGLVGILLNLVLGGS